MTAFTLNVTEDCKEKINTTFISLCDRSMTPEQIVSEAVLKDINTGIDSFYNTYKNNKAKEVFAERIDKDLDNLPDIKKKYQYLSTLMISLGSQINTSDLPEEWTKLSERDLNSQDAEEIEAQINKMKDLIIDNVDQFPKLLFDFSFYTKAVKKCRNKNADEIINIINNRPDYVRYMAVTLYSLKETGDISFITEFSPKELAISAAMAIETDFVLKSINSPETKAELISQILKTGFALLFSTVAVALDIAVILYLIFTGHAIWALFLETLFFLASPDLYAAGEDTYETIEQKIGDFIIYWNNTAVPKTKEAVSELKAFTEQKILIPLFRLMLHTIPEKFNSLKEWAEQKQSPVNDYVSNLINKVLEEDNTATEKLANDSINELVQTN